MRTCVWIVFAFFILMSFPANGQAVHNTAPSCCQQPTRFTHGKKSTAVFVSQKTVALSHEGMVWIKGGEFTVGCSNEEGRADEYPQHRVKLDGFWMDESEVTNAQFQKFV